MQSTNKQRIIKMKIKHKLTNEVLLTIAGDNLQGANLKEANLQYANLPAEVIRIDGLRWDVTISQDWITIGCQHHHIDDWDKFTDDEIAEMHDDALEFWKENKQKLITIANLTK